MVPRKAHTVEKLAETALGEALSNGEAHVFQSGQPKRQCVLLPLLVPLRVLTTAVVLHNCRRISLSPFHPPLRSC